MESTCRYDHKDSLVKTLFTGVGRGYRTDSGNEIPGTSKAALGLKEKEAEQCYQSSVMASTMEKELLPRLVLEAYGPRQI